MADCEPNTAHKLWRALLQPWLVPFGKTDWSAFADCTAPAYMVNLPDPQLRALLEQVGAGHWLSDCTHLILDGTGLYACAMSPHNAYAWQVEFPLAHEGEVGTAEEYNNGGDGVFQAPQPSGYLPDFWLCGPEPDRWELRRRVGTDGLGQLYAASPSAVALTAFAAKLGLDYDAWPGNPAD